MLDSRRPISGLTTTKALVTIQEMANHSHKWNDEEGNRGTGEYNSNRISTITDKLKSLNRDMQNLKENVHPIKGMYESVNEIYYLSSEEVKCVKATEYREDNLGMIPGNNSPSRNSSKLEEILGKYLEDSIGQEFIKKIGEEDGLPQETPAKKPGTFAKKEKKMYQRRTREGRKITGKSRKGTTVLQNELPPKEKDPRSFILPSIIGNTTFSNALADMGSCISVMPFSMFKHLGLGTPKQISMVIEMDNKVPIILGRPMLATSHARIDIFGRKISLEVPEEFEEPEGLEEFLINDDINGDLGDFLEKMIYYQRLNGIL
ncbi:hypothetical protein Tco_1506886 [Tanacetum coccineum]